MATITYENIKVSGVPFVRILECTIAHNANEHAYATIKGELDSESGNDCVERLDETSVITITTQAEGQPSTLFCGVISSTSVSNNGGYTVLEISLISTSYLLDIQRKNKSFQNKGKTYEEILNEAVGGAAIINFCVTDKATGTIVMQYNETDWQFIKRMAGEFGAPVITSITSQTPYITIGMPASPNNASFNQAFYTSGLNGDQYNNAMANKTGLDMKIMKDFSGTNVKSYNFCFVGDGVTSIVESGKVKGIKAGLVDGIMGINYIVAGENAFFSEKTSNSQIAGKMFTGIVQNVKKDTLQVHLVDIDDSFDAGGDYWFPYSTAYSSSDGSGFYCMPEVNDTVRVFFPSNKPEDAFVASSANTSPLENPKHKMWRGPGGKDILMTEEGLYINGKDGKIFINLVKDEGITIYSGAAINIMSETNINVVAHEDLVIQAENEIHIGSNESFINLTKEKIVVSATNVLIN
jgi:hypothetical protein